jgi:two-component system response regulator
VSNRRRILLVEDNPDDELLAMRVLKKSNLADEVIVARDGPEALDVLFCTGDHADRDPAALPQLVLLDLNLPKLGGIDVLRRIRGDARTRLLPVVVLTSSSEEKDLIDGYASGANSYVVKPVEYAKFADAMQQLQLYWLDVNHPAPRGA